MPRKIVCTILVSSNKRFDFVTGQHWGFGWLSGKLFRPGIIFSYCVETGEIDFSGYPWESFQEDLKAQPYKPEVLDFFKKYSEEISEFLKEGCFNLCFDGTKWFEEINHVHSKRSKFRPN